jgi:hypothetical protein
MWGVAIEVVKDWPGFVVAGADTGTWALAPTAGAMPAARVKVQTTRPTSSDAFLRMYAISSGFVKRLLKESPEALCIPADAAAENFSTEV